LRGRFSGETDNVELCSNLLHNLDLTHLEKVIEI